jgi:hypothetical protein
VTGAERLLRETLHAPELRVTPGVGLLDRARYEGERLRRRRRRRTAALTLAGLAAVVAGAAVGPRLLDRSLTAAPPMGSGLRIDPAMTAPPQTGRAVAATAPAADSHPTLWTERVAGHRVTVVAAYRDGLLCVQPASASDAAARPPACAGRAPKGTGLIAEPVGGATGLRQADATVSRVVILASPEVASVVAWLPGGDSYLGYQLGPLGPADGLLVEVVMPAGQRVLRLDALSDNGAVLGSWTPRR